MALVVTIGGVDRTAVVQKGSLTIEHRAEGFISVCNLALVDVDANIAIAIEDTITLVDGATTFFSGRVTEVSYSPPTSHIRLITLACQDRNAQLAETIVDAEEAFSAEADSDIIDSLFDDYLPAVDSETHVETIQDPLTITLGPCSLRSALSQISTRTGGYYYVDFADKLHYFDAEENVAAWYLSDDPDNVTSFPYFDAVKRVERATTRLDGVYVVGAGVEGWLGSHGVGDRTAIVHDNRITTTTGRDLRGNTILNKYNASQVTYYVSTFKAGLTAGMDVRFVCALYDEDDTFTVRVMRVKWNEASIVYYELELGAPVNPSLTGERIWTDVIEANQEPVTAPRLPVSSKGWSHDIEFSATDNDTVEWAAGGHIYLADGTSYAIDAGNTGNMADVTFVFLDLDTSSTVLQTTTDSSVAVGSKKLLIAVCEDVSEADKDAVFKVFGGGADTLVVQGHIAAGAVTTNEIAANTILAGNIAAGAIETDELAAGAVIAAKIAANTITADKMDMGFGDNIFDSDDGLLLLGPACRMLSDEWRSHRGQVADISGAFHQETGRWPGTRGLVIEPGATNLVTNPVMGTGVTGYASAWGDTVSWDGTRARFGGYSAKWTWDTVSGGGILYTLAGWAASTDYAATVWVYVPSSAVSGSSIAFSARGDGFAVLGSTPVTVFDQWTPVTVTFNTGAHSTVRLLVYANDWAGAAEIWVDGLSCIAGSVATATIAGSFGVGYAWTGTAHASTSTRAATEVNLDDQASILDGNTAFGVSLWWQAPRDCTEEWPSSTENFLFTFHEDSNNYFRLSLYGSASPVPWLAHYKQGGVSKTAGGDATFAAGEWVHIVVNVDTAGNLDFYVNGILVQSTDMSALSTISPTQANLGTGESGTLPAGGTYAEFIVMDRVFTESEIAAMYFGGRPQVDEGAQDKSGVYLLDGQFVVSSAISGARVVHDVDGIRGYNDDEKTFELNVDGSGQIGASSKEPVVWDETGLIQRLKAVQMDIGDLVFEKNAGVLLFGPNCEFTDSAWLSTRGDEAAVSGALHTVQGRFAGTRALLIEEATTNYELAPRMIDADDDDLADGWTYYDDLGSGGSATPSVITHPIKERGWLQRLEYTGAAGDSSDTIRMYDVTSVGSFAQGDDVIVTLDVRGDLVGCTLRLRITEQDAAGVGGTTHTPTEITLSRQLTRETYSITCADADCSKLMIDLYIISIDDGDTVSIDFGAVQVEKAERATSFCCGALGWCEWSGDEDDSESTRAAADVNVNDIRELLSEQPLLSFAAWFHVPYDANADWVENPAYIIHATKTDTTERILIYYDDGDDAIEVYLDDNATTVSLTSGALSFSAGDWLHVAVVLDYDNDEYYLYIDGVLVDSDTTATTPPVINKVQFGASVTPGNFPNVAFGEFALFHSVLTADQVARIYALQRPLVDAGGTKAPGIYILDGSFKIASSLSGARIEIVGEEVAGYSSDGTKQFYLSASDGIAYAGAGAVILDEDGVSLIAEDEDPSRIKWRTDAGVAVSEISTYIDSPYQYIWLEAKSPASTSYSGTIVLKAAAPAGYDYSQILIQSERNGSGGRIYLYCNGTIVMTVVSNTRIDVTGDQFVSGDIRVGGGLYVGSTGTNPPADDIWCDGHLSTDGGTTQWKLGDVDVGTITPDRKIHVEIGGQWYTLAAEVGLV
jgi:hypothetical protein